jgi:hypothetical protein
MIDFNIKRLVARLRENPIVKKIQIRFCSIIVTFSTGAVEEWIYSRPGDDDDGRKIRFKRHVFRCELGNSDPVPIRLKYEIEPDDPEGDRKANCPIIMYREFKKACFVEQRLSVQRFIIGLVKEGWKRQWYPVSELLNDFKRIEYDRNHVSKRKHWVGDMLYATSSLGYKNQAMPGRLIMEHFWDLSNLPGRTGTFRQGWTYDVLYMACIKLLKFKCDLSKPAMTRLLNSYYGYGPRIISPGPYCGIITKFDIKSDSVVDSYAGFGSKLIASAAKGASSYFTLTQPSPEILAIGQFLGVNVSKYSGQTCDVAFLDRNLLPLNCSLPKVQAKNYFVCTSDGQPIQPGVASADGIHILEPLGDLIGKFEVSYVTHALRQTLGIAPNTMLHYRRKDI